MKQIFVLVKVDVRSCLGGFDTHYQIRKFPEFDWQKKNSGPLVENNVSSISEGIKKVEELKGQLYENAIDLYWGAHETPINELLKKELVEL